MRRVVLGAALAAALAVPALASAPPRRAQGRDAQRASAAYAAMQRYLGDGRGGFRERVGSRQGAHAWPLSQALAATIELGRLRAARTQTVRLEALRSGRVYGASPGGAVYWDDNEWIAQDFLALGGARAVARAHDVFGAVVHAWDGDVAKPCAGGVQWTEAPGNDDRNTVSTVNGALVGLELYRRAPSAAVLYWARRMLDWVDACMLAGDGLVLDHIDRAGRVDATRWSYNQGSLIGALTLLTRVTGDPVPLRRAEQVADRALAYFSGSRLAQEPPEFAAIFFRNLITLAGVDGRQRYVAAAQRYADGLWARRDGRTGLSGPRLLDQAALVQVYAALVRAGR